jgi:hypothetical protein
LTAGLTAGLIDPVCSGSVVVGVGDAAVGVGDAAVGVGDAAVGVGDAAVGVGDAAVGVGGATVASEHQGMGRSVPGWACILSALFWQLVLANSFDFASSPLARTGVNCTKAPNSANIPICVSLFDIQTLLSLLIFMGTPDLKSR